MNLGVRRRVFGEMTFDESLPEALCDDVDFLRRALSRGRKIRYLGEISVTHLNPVKFRGFLRQEIRHGMGDLIFRRYCPELGGGQKPSMKTWNSESVLNAPGHAKESLKAADPQVD